MANAYVQDPSEVLFYTWDFSDLLGNYTISTASVAEATGDLSISSVSYTTTSVSAKVDATSANVEDIYRVICTITTSGLETYEKTITILVMEG